MKKQTIILSILLLTLIIGGCSSTEEIETQPIEPAPLVHIRLPMGYIPNIQYAPFYVAHHREYFKEAGFEVEFDYSFETDGITLVASNELPFTLASAEQVLLARAEGLPVVYAMGWYKDSPVAVISLAKSEIISLEDLRGKQIGIPGLFGASYIGLKALLNEGGISDQDITLDSIGFNQVEMLTSDREDAVVVYATNEPVQLKHRGYDLNMLRVADYIQLPSNGIVTNETTLRENPELVKAFIKATLRGIDATIEDPQAAYNITMNYVEGLVPQIELEQMEVLTTSISYYQQEPLGYSDLAAWENMLKVLLDMGVLKETLDLDLAVTNEFIPTE